MERQIYLYINHPNQSKIRKVALGRYKSEKFYELKKEMIMEAATEIFSRQGLEKASIRAIAAKANISTGAVYTLFSGKEAIYAELLGASLQKLHTYVTKKSRTESNPEERLRTAVTAFFQYYDKHRFEFELGMYSFSGLKRGTLGQESDRELNAALNRVLDVIAMAIGDIRESMSPERVQRERNSIFTALVGALMLGQTGRAVSIGSTPEKLLQIQLDDLLERLSE